MWEEAVDTPEKRQEFYRNIVRYYGQAPQKLYGYSSGQFRTSHKIRDHIRNYYRTWELGTKGETMKTNKKEKSPTYYLLFLGMNNARTFVSLGKRNDWVSSSNLDGFVMKKKTPFEPKEYVSGGYEGFGFEVEWTVVGKHNAKTYEITVLTAKDDRFAEPIGSFLPIAVRHLRGFDVAKKVKRAIEAIGLPKVAEYQDDDGDEYYDDDGEDDSGY